MPKYKLEMSSLEAFRKIVRQLQFDNEEPQYNQTTHELYDMYAGIGNNDLKQSGSNNDTKNNSRKIGNNGKNFEEFKLEQNDDIFNPVNHKSLFINTAEIERENERKLHTVKQRFQNTLLNDSFGAIPTAVDLSIST